MEALVVFTSRHGNTNSIAGAIADGLRAYGRVKLLETTEASGHEAGAADVIIVGGPTEGHGMTPSMSQFLDRLERDEVLRGKAVATFDTRLAWPRWLSGSAAERIAERLAAVGARVIARPESFIVDKTPALRAGERERAVAWGVALASGQVPGAAPVTPEFEEAPV